MHLLWAIIQMWQHLPAFVVRKRETNLYTDFRIVTLSTPAPPNIPYFVVANSRISVSELEMNVERSCGGQNLRYKPGTSLYGDVKTVCVNDVDQDI